MKVLAKFKHAKFNIICKNDITEKIYETLNKSNK